MLEVHDKIIDNFDKIPLVTKELVEEFYFEEDDILQIVLDQKAEKEDFEAIEKFIFDLKIPENILVKISYPWMIEN